MEMDSSLLEEDHDESLHMKDHGRFLVHRRALCILGEDTLVEAEEDNEEVDDIRVLDEGLVVPSLQAETSIQQSSFSSPMSLSQLSMERRRYQS